MVRKWSAEQKVHNGNGDLVIKNEWVNLEWPIRVLFKMICSLLEDKHFEGWPNIGFIECNLLLICLSQ